MDEEQKDVKGKDAEGDFLNWVVEKLIGFVDTPVELVYMALFVVGFLSIASLSLVGYCGNVADVELYSDKRVNDINIGSVIFTTTTFVVGSQIIEAGSCGVVRGTNSGDSTALVQFLSKTSPSFVGDVYEPKGIFSYLYESPIETLIFATESPPIVDVQVDFFDVVDTRPFTNFVRGFYLTWMFWIILVTIILGILFYRIGVNNKNLAKKIWDDKVKRDEYKVKMLENSLDFSDYKNRWEKVKALMSVENEQSWREAVLLADSIVEKTLRSSGFKGDSFGDIVKGINEDDLSSLRDVWAAHKIRNKVAHPTEDFRLSRKFAEKAINSFELCLSELGFFK